MARQSPGCEAAAAPAARFLTCGNANGARQWKPWKSTIGGTESVKTPRWAMHGAMRDWRDPPLRRTSHIYYGDPARYREAVVISRT